MKTYLAIYHAAPEAMAQMSTATAEQKAEGMKHWFAWKDLIGESLIDFGAPLAGGVNISPDGAKRTSAREVSGFSIVQAENADAAQALFEEHPHLNWHPSASIEVHEYVAM